jgi:hypothetical protein
LGRLQDRPVNIELGWKGSYRTKATTYFSKKNFDKEETVSKIDPMMLIYSLSLISWIVP